MRRIALVLTLTLAGVAALASSGAGPTAVISSLQGEVGMRLGGAVIPPRQSSAVIRDGTTYLPDSEYGLIGMFAIRFGSEVFVSEPGIRRVRATVGSTAVSSAAGERLGELSAPVVVESGRALVPLRIAEHVGLRVGWEAVTGEVLLTRSDGRTVAISRSGLVRGAGTDYSPARVGTGLSAGDVIRSWEGRAELRTSRSMIRLDRHTELTITEAPAQPGGAFAAFAAFGRVWARVVAPQPTTIETPNATASARGTAWLTEVWVDDAGRWNTRVHVQHGRVEVVERGTGRTWLLVAGESLLLDGDSALLTTAGLVEPVDDFLASTLAADGALMVTAGALAVTAEATLGGALDLLDPATSPVSEAIDGTLPGTDELLDEADDPIDDLIDDPVGDLPLPPLP